MGQDLKETGTISMYMLTRVIISCLFHVSDFLKNSYNEAPQNTHSHQRCI